MRGFSKHVAAAAFVALTLGVADGRAWAAGDPLLSQQWPLSAPSAIGAPEAWTQSRGEGVVVAVLDSGVQVNHPDLAANLWRNPGELDNGIDDDGNGIVDDIHGANILDGSANVADDDGHGTHVAGIVAARAGNGHGGAGLAPNARIMAVKVLAAGRGGDSSLLARGIRYAVDEGARILNVSLNGDATTSELDAALRYAGERGATIVASAGNNSRDLDVSPSYPAASSEPAVLSVTAADARGALLSLANHGPRSVDLAAPGDLILSTAVGSRYELRAGTSMAAPYVAGTLALMSAARPDLAQPALRAALLRSAPRPAGLLSLLGHGRLDAAAALHAVLPGAMWRTPPAAPAAAPGSVRLRLRSGAPVRAGATATLRWSATGAERVERWRVLLNGTRVATLARDDARVFRRRIARAGRHRWKVVGVDAGGARVAAAARGFRVRPRG